MNITAKFNFPRRSEDLPYRMGVGVVAINESGQILVGFTPEGIVKMPQGGIKKGEAVSDAAARELREETGYIVSDVLMVSQQPYFYDYPADDDRYIPGFRGQKFTWSLVAVKKDRGAIESREFEKHAWLVPLECIAQAKASSYQDVVTAQRLCMYPQILHEFGLLKDIPWDCRLNY